jgi:hypothetical protein
MGVRFAPTLKSANVTLSGNDLVATGTGAYVDEWAMCLPGVNPWTSSKSQKVYIEFEVTVGTASAGTMSVGMAKDVDTINWLGAPGRDSFGWWDDGSVYVNNTIVFNAGTYQTGDILSIAWDNATARAWVRKNGGAWANSGDPTAGTGAIQMDAASANGIRNFAVQPWNAGTTGKITLKSRKSQWAYAPPTGYGELADGVVQIKSGTSALATTTPTLDYPITAGNTLLYTVISGGYLTGTPSGFSADANASIQSGSGANAGMSLFRKTASGSDTFQHVQSGNFSSVWIIAEIEGLDTTTPFNIAASNFNNSAAGNVALSQAATPTGSADYIAITAVFNETTNSPQNQPFTSVFDGFDEASYNGITGAGGAGGSHYTIAMLTSRGTAAGAAVTGGATTPDTSSGNHTVGAITMILNVAAAGGGTSTLTADPGSFAWTPRTADLSIQGRLRPGYKKLWRRQPRPGRLLASNFAKAPRGLTNLSTLATFEFFDAAVSAGTTYPFAAAQGSFTMTGNAADVLAAKVLASGQGSFAVNGQNADLLAARILAAAQGSFTLTGNAVTLLNNRALPAAQGSFTTTGNNADLLAARILAASQGSFTLTGFDPTIVGPGSTYVLGASAGSFGLTGQNADVLYGRAIAAAQATFSMAGQNASLLAARILAAAQGSFSMAGQSATIARALLLTADPGSFSLNGQAVTFNYATATYTLAAGPGSFSVNAVNGSPLYSRVFPLDCGLFTVSVRSADLQKTVFFTADGEIILVPEAQNMLMVGREDRTILVSAQDHSLERDDEDRRIVLANRLRV